MLHQYCLNLSRYFAVSADKKDIDCNQLWFVWPTLSADNARMLAHAFIAGCVNYYNSILYKATADHLCPLQLVLNATACVVVKNRKCDSIIPTIRDNLHLLLVQQRVVDFKICLLVYKCLHQLAAHTSCR